MIPKLSAKEEDLLQRVEEKEDLRPLFFRKVKGLKWFDSLSEKGYFNPAANPKPVEAKEKGYVNIPYWSAVDYLVKTAPELSNIENVEYAGKFLEILEAVTNYAKAQEFSNYRTWWQFSEIISQIPSKCIDLDQIDIVDYWLDDKYEGGLVSQIIGEKWLPKLLETSDKHGLQLASKLITLLYKVVIIEKEFGEKVNRESTLRFDHYHAQKITKKVAHLAGAKLGREAVLIFDSLLKHVLIELNSDSWSSLWHPAIEEHEQNKYKHDAENILVEAYRDSLSGYIGILPEEACEYTAGMLDEQFQTIRRLAIFIIDRNYFLFHNLTSRLLLEEYLHSNYRHEMWHFFEHNYQQFNADEKQKVLELIFNITRTDDKGNVHEGATAYSRAIWLAAIKNHGEKEARLYKENVEIGKTEPDHPDFSSYMSVGWSGHESPIPLEELQALSTEELIEVLGNYKDPGGFREPGIEGLAKTVNQLIKTAPLRYYSQLIKFSEIDLAYIYEIIEAYRDLWTEKSQLPWDDIWPCLFAFCSAIINQYRFWKLENAKDREHFVANRYWIVSGIGRLLEAGTKSDDHAFNEEYIQDAEDLISLLLNKEEGSEYKIESDAVSISINSPRGHCLEALINLTLRSCRLSDKKNKDHSDVWTHYQPLYDAELERVDLPKPEYEFATLITNYLPNFLYMSRDWVFSNLFRIFDKEHYLKWLCAMQGYAYVGIVYQEIYQYLKEHGDFIKALDDENIKDRVEDKVIQNIAVAYINGFEKYSDENSLISILISRKDYTEISHLIWFIWTLRKKDDENLRSKVYELWPKILEVVDLSTKEGRKIASQLCHWSIFVDRLDNERRTLLLAIAPYSDEEHNSNELLKSIANISQNQPFEAYTIWIKMLEGASSDYPEEAVRKTLMNLVNQGHEGLRKARDIVSQYLKNGNERPATLLREIRKEI